MVIDLGVRTNKLHKPISNFSILVPKFETNFLIHACVHDLGTVSVMGVNLDNTQFYMLDLLVFKPRISNQNILSVLCSN